MKSLYKGFFAHFCMYNKNIKIHQLVFFHRNIFLRMTFFIKSLTRSVFITLLLLKKNVSVRKGTELN